MFCPNCGNPFEKGERFCGYCGYDIGARTLPEKSVPEKPDRKKLWIVIAAAAVLIAAVAVLALYFLRPEGTDVPSDNSGTPRSAESQDAADMYLPVVMRVFDENAMLEYYIEYSYDDNGNATEEDTYNADGSLRENRGSVYDADGNELESWTYSVLLGNSKTTYTYDDRGNILTRNSQSGLAYVAKFDYVYDESGYVLSCVEYLFNGSEYNYFEKTEFVRDEAGNVLSKKCYGETGELKYAYEFTRDAEGRKLTEVCTDGNGVVSYSSELTYDAHGNILTSIIYNGDGTVSNRYDYEYEYDSHGNILVAREYSAERFDGWREYEYDTLSSILSD